MGAGAPAGTKTNSPLLMHKLQPKQNRRGPRAGAAEGGGGRERAERGRQRDRDINKPLQRTKIKIETSGEPGGRGTVTRRTINCQVGRTFIMLGHLKAACHTAAAGHMIGCHSLFMFNLHVIKHGQIQARSPGPRLVYTFYRLSPLQWREQLLYTFVLVHCAQETPL